MDYHSQVLQPNERVKAVGNLHWSVYLSGVLMLALADILVFIAFGKGPGERHVVLVSAAIIFVAAVAGNKIPVLTRSLLGVLGAVAAEIQVPEEDVRDGETVATIRELGGRRPIIVYIALSLLRCRAT